MPRYHLFKKGRSYDYKFLGSSEAKSATDAIRQFKMGGGFRGTPIIIAVPNIGKFQYNPQKTPGGGVKYKKPR